MIGRNGERRSGISAQAARHDDDDDLLESERNSATGVRTRVLRFRSPALSPLHHEDTPLIFFLKLVKNMWVP